MALPAEPLQAVHGGAGLVKAWGWGGWGDVGWRLAGSAEDVAALASLIDVSRWPSRRVDYATALATLLVIAWRLAWGVDDVALR
jgi:hypothetical protein